MHQLSQRAQPEAGADELATSAFTMSLYVSTGTGSWKASWPVPARPGSIL
jgi:hypothetical protein